MEDQLRQIYAFLLNCYGPQGWWPLSRLELRYHPKDYSFPKSIDEKFEIGVGAILTQNTSWSQVQKVLLQLEKMGALSPAAFPQHMQTAEGRNLILEAIRPAGYFNQKAKKLEIFSRFFQELNGQVPTRQQLLSLWGIGEETADSILLYAFNVPTFVVDTYTKRIFTHLGLLTGKVTYQKVKEYFEERLPADLILYQEYHALIVCHAKLFYSRKPYGRSCPLSALL